MTVKELTTLLITHDPNSTVEIEQLFIEHRAVSLKSVVSKNGKVILRDHHLLGTQHSTFTAHDGTEFDVPPLAERYLNI